MLRRGYSLIEMIAALTMGAAVVGIGVGTLHTLLRTERTGRDRVPQAGVLARLAQQFRGDVHAAVRQVPDANQKQWQFALSGDCLVTYRALPGEVQRSQQQAGKLVRQESYVLPGGCSAAIAVQRQPASAVASLIIADHGAPAAVGCKMCVAAVLGKDHRFTKSPVGGQ